VDGAGALLPLSSPKTSQRRPQLRFLNIYNFVKNLISIYAANFFIVKVKIPWDRLLVTFIVVGAVRLLVEQCNRKFQASSQVFTIVLVRPFVFSRLMARKKASINVFC
jgi:hypothetical protein